MKIGSKVVETFSKEGSLIDNIAESNSVLLSDNNDGELKKGPCDFIPKDGSIHLIFENISFLVKIEFSEEKKEAQLTYKPYSENGFNDKMKVLQLIVSVNAMGIKDISREQFFERYDMFLLPRVYENNGLLKFKPKNFKGKMSFSLFHNN